MRNIHIPLVFCATLIYIVGCSYALVTDTNDPNKKIDQAYQMWEVGRWIPAEGLGLQALDIAEKKEDLLGQANAHRYLGNFYKGRLYRQHHDWFAEQGRYDQTSRLSIEYFKKALEIWRSMGDGWGVATELFNMGTAYSIDGDNKRSCELYAEAITIYKSPDTLFQGVSHPWNRNFKDFPSMVEAFAKSQGCGDKNMNEAR